MEKYIIFGWSEGNAKEGPADELLGTWHQIHEADEQEYKVENGVTQFGYKLIELDVTLDKKLFGGKTYRMPVLVSYGAEGIEKASRILAYYKIPEGNN